MDYTLIIPIILCISLSISTFLPPQMSVFAVVYKHQKVNKPDAHDHFMQDRRGAHLVGIQDAHVPPALSRQSDVAHVLAMSVVLCRYLIRYPKHDAWSNILYVFVSNFSHYSYCSDFFCLYSFAVCL